MTPRKIAIIPAYNEEAAIRRVLDDSAAHFDLTIVVDDGSTDRTAQIIAGWISDTSGQAQVLSLERNQGMAAALGAGMSHVLTLLEKGDVGPDDLVVHMDADGQHRSEDIDRLCSYLLSRDLALVQARRDFSNYPAIKRLGNMAMSALGGLCAGRRWHDIECGFRVVRAKALANILPYYRGRRYSCAQELAVIASRLRLPLSNEPLISVPYFRSNTRLKDALFNPIMGACAALRVALDLRSSISRPIAAASPAPPEPINA